MREVVEQLAAELQVELAAELLDAFTDTCGLQLDVLVVVETDFHAATLSPIRVLVLGRTKRKTPNSNVY